VLVAGAGVADLVAATRLPTAGFDVVVLEVRDGWVATASIPSSSTES